MSLEWPARSSSLAWSNPLAWWWGLLTLVSGANIAVWFLLYRQLQEQPTGSLGSMSSIELMLLLCAAYVFGCAFRSFLPRADVQRICLFDTWLSSVVIGRSVATVAENLLRGAVGDYPAPTSRALPWFESYADQDWTIRMFLRNAG
jgi:nitrate reductase gamma subunit